MNLIRFSRARIYALALLLALFSGCTNNLLQNALNSLNTVNGGNPLGGVGDGSNSAGLELASVQLDTFNPTTTLDLLGDGSGSMGTACIDQPNAATPGATTCTCAYTYILANGTQVGPVEVDTIYHENNMLRCSYSQIPKTGVPYINIYIHLAAGDTKSNTVTLQLGAGAGGALDLSNPLSYSKGERFQCRDIVKVPYVWDPSIYDPFVSEDPRYSYPLNFYTTNMGGTLAMYASDKNTPSWNCPALPNDTAAGMDLSLYSVSADSAGSKAIFPPGGAFDRSTFYLANAATGIFTVPVQAFIYPTAFSVTPDPKAGGATGAPPPMGYAANPIPLSGGGETCPDASVLIPPNYHWAKLWLFRKQLPQRAYPVSNNLSNFGSSQIACNSPPWQSTPLQAAPKDTEFTDCSKQASWNNLDANRMAARFSLATGQCFNIIPGGATNPSTRKNYTGVGTDSAPAPQNGINFSAFAPGSDIWNPARQDRLSGCGGTATSDISHACQSSTGNVPWDSNNLPANLIDPSTSNPRFDYLFVVSPPSVNRKDMYDTAQGVTHSIYTPVRFMSPTDCKSSDPDQPTFPGDCSPSRKLTYGMTVNQVGAGGQTGTTDPSEPGDYPMCVLQPN